MPIFIDIETSRGSTEDPLWTDLADSIRDAHPTPQPPSEAADLAPPKNYKDPEKIAAWQAAKHAELLAEYEEGCQRADREIGAAWESTPLRPLYGRVLCVGVAVDDRAPACVWESSEKVTLAKLEKGLAAYPDEPLVAHNGCNFDFRFLAIRAAHHGLFDLSRRVYCGKPWGDRMHIDTRAAWSGAARGRDAEGRLIQIAELLGIARPPDDIDGSLVPALWHSVKACAVDDPVRVKVEAQIRGHVLHDVEVLREVWRRMTLAGWI